MNRKNKKPRKGQRNNKSLQDQEDSFVLLKLRQSWQNQGLEEAEWHH